MPNPYNNCQKQTHFLNSHIRQWRPTFVQCVQNWWSYLFVTCTNICIISKKKNLKTLSKKESLLMWGASVCHNPLGTPVNLWTTGAVGQCVLSLHCVKLASAVSLSATISLSRNDFIFRRICETQHLLTDHDSSVALRGLLNVLALIWNGLKC